MARFRCLNCRGEYRDTDRRRARYFHACPDGRIVEGQGFVPFSPDDMRDENVTRAGRMKAEGKGRERIPDFAIGSLSIGEENNGRPN